MADRIVENADLILDETKRKARRRLVGAIVLALGAVIILPMLFEKEPRPLGDDVSVRIPPVDETKFINKLSGKSGEAKPLPKSDDKAEPKAAGEKSQPRGESKPDAPAAPPQGEPPAAPAADEASASKRGAEEPRASAPPAPAASSAAAEPAAVAKSNRKDAPAGATSAVAEPKASASAQTPASTVASAAPIKPEGFVVQLAAFADDKGANSLANRLKKAGYAAFVEPVQTSRGMLWRVRVGGFGTRPEADAARARLKGEGMSGIVTPAS